MTERDRDRGLAGLNRAECWVFDLDNTLYPAACNLFAQVDRRMCSFIAGFLDVSEDQARAMQKQYFQGYGTTLRGLMERHGLAPQPFLDYVHDLDLSVVQPSPALDAALAALEGRKLIFTNASSGHAERVMRRLGVERRFEAIFDIADADYRPKPDPEVYARLVARHGLAPRATVMVEDIARNLAPAAALGMTTVWVRTPSAWGQEGHDGDHVHHVADDLVAWLESVVAAAPAPRPG